MNRRDGFLLAILAIVLLATMMDYLALTDIHHEYVSKDMLLSQKHAIETDTLPQWTECNVEWIIVQLSMLTRFMAMVIAMLYLFLGKGNKHSNKAKEK